jgi:hypothetical protein
MDQKISRNVQCPCGSGRKYKHCCPRVRSATTESRLLPPAPPRLNGGSPTSLATRHAAPRPAITKPTDRRDWQEVQAVLEQPTGDIFVAVMLYSREWLRSRNVRVGGPIPLNIPKYRVRGEGRVRSIQPTTETAEGEGLVVSFTHLREEPEERSLPPVAERTWQQVHVRLEEPDNVHVYLVLLHSSGWLRLRGIKNGGGFPLNLPQQKVQGSGRVALIEPSPMRSDGEGRVMTFVRNKKQPEAQRPEPQVDPLSRPGVRTFFGERLPPVGHDWLPLVLSQAGGLTADLRLIRPTPWMNANWHLLEEIENDHELPAEVAQWRLVHLSVSVQGGQKVHLSLFWRRREVEAYGLTVGEPVLLRLPQDQLSGEGTLTAIEPAPFVPEPGMPQGMISVTGKQGGQCRGTIESMEVGDYVTTYTHEERGDRLPIDNTQGKWVARQRIKLHLDKEDGGHSKIVFLRDAKWVRTEQAVVGGTVYLNMPDMGCVGHARVEAIEPCLVFLRWGNSSIRMVTGTFAHSEGLCGDLKLKGESKPLGVTPLHPIWSEDRQDWVPAGELVPGETVKTVRGTTTVESYAMRDKPEPVFNMEVEGDHVYRVGDQGVLVHNASFKKGCNPCEEVTKHTDETFTDASSRSLKGTWEVAKDTDQVCRVLKVEGWIELGAGNANDAAAAKRNWPSRNWPFRWPGVECTLSA